MWNPSFIVRKLQYKKCSDTIFRHFITHNRIEKNIDRKLLNYIFFSNIMLEVAKVAKNEAQKKQGIEIVLKRKFKIELAIKYIHLESSSYYLSAQ